MAGPDLDLSESVGTWMCHALAGSIGAVVNGLELLKEDNQTHLKETVELVDASAVAAAHRLRFFRAVFGVADGTVANPGTSLELLRSFLKASRSPAMGITVEWPEEWGEVSPRIMQLALSMALLGAECLPRAGVMTLRVEASALVVIVRGQGVRFDEGNAAALTLTQERLPPRNVPGLFSAHLARRLGAEITAARTEDRVELTAAPLAVRGQNG